MDLLYEDLEMSAFVIVNKSATVTVMKYLMGMDDSLICYLASRVPLAVPVISETVVGVFKVIYLNIEK